MQTLRNREFIRHFDKEVTRMCFYQSIVSGMASLPFATISLYRSLTSQMVRSPDQENIVQFFRFLAIGLFYVQYCTDYYLYLIIHPVRCENERKKFYSSDIIIPICLWSLFNFMQSQCIDYWIESIQITISQLDFDFSLK